VIYDVVKYIKGTETPEENNNNNNLTKNTKDIVEKEIGKVWLQIGQYDTIRQHLLKGTMTILFFF